MRQLLLIILLVVISIATPVTAEIHKWVDSHGKIHYGDRPPMSDDVESLEISIESFSSVEIRELNQADLSILSSEVKQNVKSKKVVMYSTQNCGYCKKAKAYFETKGISYTERDINQDKKARRQWEKLNGTGVPLILIGTRKMSGFSAERFEKIYYSNS